MPKQILTPEEKLKNLRKRFGLKQHEVTGGQITRNLISMIENGKARLTHDNGIKIIENINKILQKRSIEIVLSPEEILETVEDQIEKITVDYLEKFNKSPDTDLIKEINLFLSNKKYTHTKFQLYKNIGNFYYHNSDFYSSIIYYSKIYDLSVKYETGDSLYELISNYTDSLMKLMLFKDVLHTIKSIDPFSTNISKEQRADLIIKKVEALVMQARYEYALNTLTEADLTKEIKDDFNKIYLKWLEGFLNVKLEKLTVAKKIFDRLINSKSDFGIVTGKLGLATLNNTDSNKDQLSELINSIESSLETFDEIKTVIFTSRQLAELYLSLNNYSKSEFYFKKIFETEEEIFSLDEKYFAVSNLLNIYNLTNKDNEIFNLQHLAAHWVKKNYLKKNDPVFFKFIRYYSKNNLTDKITELLNELNFEI